MTNQINTVFRVCRQFLQVLKSLTLILSFSFSTLTVANSIIAIVDDEIITLDTISNQIKPNATKAAKMALVNRQIDLILQLKKVREIGIRPKPNAINIMLDNIATQNKLTRAQLKSSPEFDSIVDNITQNLALRGLKQYVLSGIEVNLTQAEIDTELAKNRSKVGNFNKQIKIAQILINSIDQSATLLQSKDELIKQFLIELSKKINNGTSFVSLAKLHSQDASYKNGGESRWLNPTKLPAALKSQLANLKLGQLSPPFLTEQGWRIIKIIKERDATDSQLAAIKSQLIQSQQNTYFKGWVKKLRKSAYIEIFGHKF